MNALAACDVYEADVKRHKPADHSSHARASTDAAPSAIVWKREDFQPTLHELAWLASPEGQAVCTEMAEHPADTPTAILRWRERLDAALVSAAWMQVTLRRAAVEKFTLADQMLLDRVGLEQSSGEVVATHKARRFAGMSAITDLCCGIGGDSLALAEHAPVAAVDISGPRVTMAEYNAGVYGRRATGIIGDVTLTHPPADAAHIDPDRRPGGRRAHDADRGSPDLAALESILRRYANAAVKLSPGTDFAELPFEAEIELISHHGNCKQAVAWTGGFKTALRRATVLPAGTTLSADSADALAWPPRGKLRAGAYLLEPDPAVIRANLVGVLARQLDAQPLDPRIAWLVAERPAASPLVHCFEVLDMLPFNQKKLRPWLVDHQIGTLEIKTRGTAVVPEVLARQLRLRGSRPATLLVTRLGEDPVAILATRRPVL